MQPSEPSHPIQQEGYRIRSARDVKVSMVSRLWGMSKIAILACTVVSVEPFAFVWFSVPRAREDKPTKTANDKCSQHADKVEFYRTIEQYDRGSSIDGDVSAKQYGENRTNY